MQLNSKQEEAKQKINGSLLIIAWAWSWKTATLTARVEYMIREKNILPSSIIMVTFTNKAANEMRKRVAQTLWTEIPKNLYVTFNFPLIWTFHSIWIFILKEILTNFSSEELWLGIKKDFVIYDEQDKTSILKNIIKERFRLNEKEYPAKLIASYISNAKNSLITAKEYETEVNTLMKEVVWKVYTEYEKVLKTNNAMDFDDILIKLYKALNNEKILEIYQERYKYIMVDEYQDTNLVQYKIVKLLASKYQNIAVVWDDAQSIYSWRGADMKNIINFKKDYPDALIIKLEQNYRSTKKIISWANFVISKNNMWIKKELWTDNDEWKHIVYIEAPDDKLEAKIIVDIIKKTENKYLDNLILYRTNTQSRAIEEALLRENIPYRVVGWTKFYDRAEIKDLLAYLKVIYNKNDVVSIKRIINKPTRKIGDRTIEVLDNYREKFDKNYLQIIENIDEIDELNSGAKNALKSFLELYKFLVERAKEMEVSYLLEEILKTTKYIDFITEWLPEEEKQSKKDNIDELKNVASEYNGMENSLGLFLEEIALITDMDIKDERSDYVTLMSIHMSKWLEEKRVFITGLEEWLFPWNRSLLEQFALEEERRLMYVAMTRAKEELYISRALERFYFGEFKRNLESRFIKEIPSEFIEKYDLSEYLKSSNNFFSYNSKSIQEPFSWYNRPKPQIQNNDVSQFLIWDKVSHPKFWNWLITELVGEIASIAFPWNGIKKLNIRIAPVKKV